MSFDPPPRPNVLIEFGGNRTVPQGSPTVVWDLWFELFAKTALTTSGPGVTLTEGSVLFIDSGGNVTEDNSNFFWDDTNNILCLGTTSGEGDFTINHPGSGISLSLKDETNVATGMTDIAETDDYGFLKKVNDTKGGLNISGLADDNSVHAVQINGYKEAAPPP